MVVLSDTGRMTSSLKFRGASSSSSSAHQWMYDVFLSFRGADTRRTFTAHLYDALDRNGLNTFIDGEQLRGGEEIPSEPFKAIEVSRVSVVVLSKNYASSTWCLDELTKIFECRVKKGQLIVPLFYGVNPSDVRNQRGTIGESFAKHEARFRDNPEKVERWKAVLRQVGSISGWHLDGDSWHEPRLIHEIVHFVKNYKNLQLAKHPIEIESPVQESNLSSSSSLDGIESSVQEPHLSRSPSPVGIEYLVQEPDSPPSQVGIESSVQELDLSNFSSSVRTESRGTVYRVQEPDRFPSQVVIEAAVLLLHLSSLASANGEQGNNPSISSEQGSNSSISSEGVILILIGLVIGLLQLGNLFETHPVNMWITMAASVMCSLSYAAMRKITGTHWAKYSQIIDIFRILSGTLVLVSLASIHLPHHLWWLFFAIWAVLAFIIIVAAVIWIYWAKINAAVTRIYSRARGRGFETRNRHPQA